MEFVLLYLLTLYLAWSFLFVPLFIKKTKNRLLAINPELKEFTESLHTLTWQRMLIEYIFYQDKNEFHNVFMQGMEKSKTDKRHRLIAITLGQFIVSRSLILLLFVGIAHIVFVFSYQDKNEIEEVGSRALALHPNIIV